VTRRRLLALFTVVGAAIVVVAIAVRPGLGGGGSPAVRLRSASADPSNGPALAHEAIANLRASERFRFAQEVTRTDGPSPATQTADGAVDLSSGADDPPRVRTESVAHPTKGGTSTVIETRIGDDVYLRDSASGHAEKHAVPKSHSKGKGAHGHTAEAVELVDPAMPLLEAADALPDSAFGTPSAPDAEGVRTVVVTLGGPDAGATLVLSIDNEHILRATRYEDGRGRSSLRLSDIGASDIEIDSPS
jgi:hypothetical protein